MASGHVNRIYRPNTWLHRPMLLQNVQKALANSEPSTHGTSRTSRDVRLESEKSAKADIAQAALTLHGLESLGPPFFRFADSRAAEKKLGSRYRPRNTGGPSKAVGPLGGHAART
jgi:hypothetical protein